MRAVASGDFGPAPPGVNLADNQNSSMFGSVLVVAIIGTFAVGLRVVARTKGKDVSMAIDDYLILVALVSFAS